MTETELILGSLTIEELDDAHRYVAMLGRSWRSQSKDETRRVGLDTDGPFHAIAALAAAVLHELLHIEVKREQGRLLVERWGSVKEALRHTHPDTGDTDMTPRDYEAVIAFRKAHAQ